MPNENHEIVRIEDVPLGYEPLVFADAQADGLAQEYQRLRLSGHIVLLCDNGDGTYGLWQLQIHFWLH
jgi:hypothetical protein